MKKCCRHWWCAAQLDLNSSSRWHSTSPTAHPTPHLWASPSKPPTASKTSRPTGTTSTCLPPTPLIRSPLKWTTFNYYVITSFYWPFNSIHKALCNYLVERPPVQFTSAVFSQQTEPLLLCLRFIMSVEAIYEKPRRGNKMNLSLLSALSCNCGWFWG